MTNSKSFQEETMLNNTNSTVDVERRNVIKLNGISWNVSQCGDMGLVGKYPK
jgi:hypothetical protein